MSRNAALILVPPGRRRVILKLLKEELGESRVFAIESTICEKVSKVGKKMHMFDVLNEYPRNEVRRMWKDAVKEIASAINQSPHGEKVQYFIIGHAVYHKNWTREFFSVVDSTFLKHRKKLKISHVILMTDDLQDVYSDLTEPDELYGDSALMFFLNENPAASQFWKAGGSGNAKSYIGWVSEVVHSVLEWRAQEIILAQKVADELGVRFMLWGLKQDIGTLLQWICSSNPPIYYISHPISEPRRLEHDGHWPPIVKLVNALQIRFAKTKLYTVMPTAIDELRFEKTTGGSFTSLLKRRWPVPSTVRRSLKRSAVLRRDYEAIKLFSTKRVEVSDHTIKKVAVSIAKVQPFLDGSFTAMETTIYDQMANRDHLLVWLTNGIIVIEPWSTRERDIHRGVKKEMLYLSQMNQKLPPHNRKRICAIFSTRTVDRVSIGKSFGQKYVEKLRRLISTRYGIGEATADRVVNDNGELNTHAGGSLGPNIPDNKAGMIMKDIDKLQDDALIHAFLKLTMEMTEAERDLIMPIRLNDLNELLHLTNGRRVSAFLSGKRGNKTEYEDLVARIRKTRKV